MEVTAVEPRKKALDAIFVDGEFYCNLDYEIVISEKVKAGITVTDEILEDWLFKSDFKRAKSKAIWLLNYRDYTKKDLLQKLLREYNQEVADKAILRMEELHLINDERYARRYAKDLINLKHLSPMGAKQKLMQKGIDRDLCDSVLEEIQVDEKEQIRYLVEHKYKNNLSDEKGMRRAVSGLQRRGFRWDDIKHIIDEYIEE